MVLPQAEPEKCMSTTHSDALFATMFLWAMCWCRDSVIPPLPPSSSSF
jgi:hypothetical protein